MKEEAYIALYHNRHAIPPILRQISDLITEISIIGLFGIDTLSVQKIQQISLALSNLGMTSIGELFRQLAEKIREELDEQPKDRDYKAIWDILNRITIWKRLFTRQFEYLTVSASMIMNQDLTYKEAEDLLEVTNFLFLPLGMAFAGEENQNYQLLIFGLNIQDRSLLVAKDRIQIFTFSSNLPSALRTRVQSYLFDADLTNYMYAMKGILSIQNVSVNSSEKYSFLELHRILGTKIEKIDTPRGEAFEKLGEISLEKDFLWATLDLNTTTFSSLEIKIGNASLTFDSITIGVLCFLYLFSFLHSEEKKISIFAIRRNLLDKLRGWSRKPAKIRKLFPKIFKNSFVILGMHIGQQESSVSYFPGFDFIPINEKRIFTHLLENSVPEGKIPTVETLEQITDLHTLYVCQQIILALERKDPPLGFQFRVVLRKRFQELSANLSDLDLIDLYCLGFGVYENQSSVSSTFWTELAQRSLDLIEESSFTREEAKYIIPLLVIAAKQGGKIDKSKPLKEFADQNLTLRLENGKMDFTHRVLVALARVVTRGVSKAQKHFTVISRTVEITLSSENFYNMDLATLALSLYSFQLIPTSWQASRAHVDSLRYWLYAIQLSNPSLWAAQILALIRYS
ncbi:MAG: hypothetical protein ACFFDI_31015 [Promethearchaeota archaeon]